MREYFCSFSKSESKTCENDNTRKGWHYGKWHFHRWHSENWRYLTNVDILNNWVKDMALKMTVKMTNSISGNLKNSNGIKTFPTITIQCVALRGIEGILEMALQKLITACNVCHFENVLSKNMTWFNRWHFDVTFWKFHF